MPMADARCTQCGHEVHGHHSHCENCGSANVYHPSASGHRLVLSCLAAVALFVAWFIWRMSLI